MHLTRVRVAKVMVEAEITVLLAWRNNSLLVSLKVEGFYIYFSAAAFCSQQVYSLLSSSILSALYQPGTEQLPSRF